MPLMRTLPFLFLLVLTTAAIAQKTITIDDIWTHGTFRTKGVPGFRFMNDGKHYTTLRQNYLLKYDLTSGELTDTLIDFNMVKFPGEQTAIDGYTFSDDESQLLVSSATESIYRHSTKEWNYIYQVNNGKLTPLADLDTHESAGAQPDP